MTQSRRFVRPVVQRMAPYVPGEQPQGGGWIKLNTNENPYPPSPRVAEALRAALGDSLRLYPDPVSARLRDRAAARYGVDRDCILAGNGSDELLSLIVRGCAGAAGRVAYPTPTYSLYDTLVTIEEAEPIRLPATLDGTLPADLAATGAQVYFICHPNAPTGVAVRLDEVERLASAVDGLVVVDEAYVDFAEHSAIPLTQRFDNVLVLRTFSKSFSLAGMRVGLAIGPREVIADLGKVKDSYNLNRLSQVAAEAALDDYEWMRAHVEQVKQTRTRLTSELRTRGFEVPESSSNFVLARKPGHQQRDTYLGLKDRRVLVRYFPLPGLDDAMRITVGTDAEIDALLAGLDEIAAG